MNRVRLFACLALALPALEAFAFQIEGAYHSAGDRLRATETVPGESFPFLANGSTEVSSADTVTLYVLTAPQFAGDREEQVFVRWWDGSRAHWILGSWLKTLEIPNESAPERFRDPHASDPSVALDLWKIDVPPWVTQPGLNFYAIQLKSLLPDSSEARYLVWKAGGGFSRTNRLGQIWSASEEIHGQDWPLTILP